MVREGEREHVMEPIHITFHMLTFFPPLFLLPFHQFLGTISNILMELSADALKTKFFPATDMTILMIEREREKVIDRESEIIGSKEREREHV